MLEVEDRDRKEKKELNNRRQMNFELLRIVSMMMIILHHYSLYGGLIGIETISINKFIGEFIYIGGKLGTVLFVMISGYFLIDKTYKFKNLIKVILEVFFYSVSIYMILVLCKKIEFSPKDLIKSLFPIIYNQYWFATSYVGLYIFIPFINKLIKNMNEFQYKLLIIIGMIIFVIIPTIVIGGGDGFIGGISYFIYLYMLSGYLKKYNFNMLRKKKNCIILIITVLCIMMLVSVISTYLAQDFSIFENGITYLSNQHSVTIVLLAIGIFQLFRYTNIKYNKFIEICATVSFSVYLIHENPYFQEVLWKEILKVQNYYDANILSLTFNILFSVIFIYGISLLIDLFRKKFLEEKIFETIYKKYFETKIKKVENILNDT